MVAQVSGTMAFTRPEEVSDDTERKGVKRAANKAHFDGMDFEKEFDIAECVFQDCLAEGAEPLNLETMGFDTLDLSQNKALQSLLEEVRVAGRVDQQQGEKIRKLIKSRSYRLSNGKKVRFLYVAPEGFIVRKAGPNGLKPDPKERMEGSNGHDGARNAHGDQDVYGTPLKQILKGFAPKLFRHDTPDGKNTVSPVFLVNLWVPLQQITRPLTLMDRRTLNKDHQLRFSLATDSFLERKEDMVQNDIWTFLYDAKQKWHFHSKMNANKAYVFDTLGEPHGAFILPGEARAEQLYKQLENACEALEKSDWKNLELNCEVDIQKLPEDITEPLRKAILNMEALLKEVQAFDTETKTSVKDSWLENARLAMDAVVRKSLEMRVVALVTPF
jgi:hypothetical protein